MRFAILLLPVSIVITSPLPMQKLPRQLLLNCPQPSDPFANFDCGQDTVSTDFFDTLPSSSSFYPSADLDPNAFLFDSEIPPDDLTYSLIPFREVYGDIGQGPPLARILRVEQLGRTRFFPVPTRKCDPGTRPFCATYQFVTQEGPNNFSLRSASDRMSSFLHSHFYSYCSVVFGEI